MICVQIPHWGFKWGCKKRLLDFEGDWRYYGVGVWVGKDLVCLKMKRFAVFGDGFGIVMWIGLSLCGFGGFEYLIWLACVC